LTVPTNDKNSGKLTGSVFYRKLAVVIIGTETTIGISYIIGGIIPLSAYLFTRTPLQGLLISALLTIICLLLFGYFKSKATGQPPLKGALKVMLIGITAAVAAFLVAKLFNGLF
jgi:predicted membrane protein (TIGR00267 family)